MQTALELCRRAGDQHGMGNALNALSNTDVDLAARIESHTKIAGCHILIDAETRLSLPESLPVDSLGEVVFKGKTVPVQIYSVRAE